jgi:pimeloyl-ACP methyl ester carboxylesterase
MNSLLFSKVAAGRAPVNGLDMYYEIAGEGAPAVFIHPFASHASVHGDLLPRMIPNRRWIAMDLQAHGRTPDIDRPLSYEQEADDVAALIRFLDLEKVDVFGESLGGIAAMVLAVRHPELIRRLAIYGSVLGRFEEVTRPESLASFRSLTPDHHSVQFQREDYQRVAPDPDQWPQLFAKATRRAWNGLSSEVLKTVNVPVLVAVGDHDVLGPPVEHALEVSRALPAGELAVIPDAGHFLLYDEPEKLVPMIGRFFDAPEKKVPFATTFSGYHPGETR